MQESNDRGPKQSLKVVPKVGTMDIWGREKRGELRDEFLVSLSGWKYQSLAGTWVLRGKCAGEDNDYVFDRLLLLFK